MAASSSSLASNGIESSGGPGLYQRLNTQWHERALQVFMVIVLAHWSEHLAQAIQIYFLGWPRPKANGVLGLWYPWLITSELMHYLYALVMLIGLWVLRKGFTGTARKWWTIALVIQFWHHIEHLLLITQATHAPQLLAQTRSYERSSVVFPAGRIAPLLQHDCVHPNGDRHVLPHVSAGRRTAAQCLYVRLAFAFFGR